MILEVRIKAPPGGSVRTLRFSKSPVRIGRNQLNDISLEDPFVSEWHGTIRFDEGSVAYFDLGSTNGTLLEGKRLPKNVATDLSDTSRLQLGLLEVVVSREASAPSEPPPRLRGTGPQKTLAWGRPDTGAGAGGGATGGAGVGGGAAGSAALSGQALSTGPLPSAPPADGRGAEATRPAPTGSPPSEASREDQDSSLVQHQTKLLEAFTEAFIGLRKGYEQFGAEVGVRTINGSTPLHRARSRRELLDYLLQPNVDTAAATRDLIAIFADFGIHHIAMMQGVTEGVRAMLQSLNPRANDIDAGGRLFGGSKNKGQWKAYLERFDQMITDDNELHAAIFGNEFARAYASVTMGDGGKPAPTEDED